MTCHHGYAPQHAIFVLLYLAVIAKLIASRKAALEIRVVGSACSLAAMACHLVLAAACESPSVSTVLDAHWTNSLARLRVPYVVAFRLSLAFAASWCTIKGSGRFKAAKLAVVCMPVLASACVGWWICSVEGGIEDLFAKFMALGGVGVPISWLVIHAATGSRTMTWCTYSITLLLVSGALLRKAYSLGPDGRIMPSTTDDAIHPHWSAPSLSALMNSGHIIAHAAALQAVISHSNPQPSPLLPTPCSSLLKAATAALPAWHVIQVLFAAVTVAMLPLLSTTPPWHGRVRELLAMHTVQEGSRMWWWALAGLAAATFVVALEPPPLAPFIEFWYKTRYQRNKEKKTAKMLAAITRKMEAQGPVELSGEVYSIDEGSVPGCLRDAEPLNKKLKDGGTA